MDKLLQLIDGNVAAIICACIGLVSTVLSILFGTGKLKVDTAKKALTAVIAIISKLPELIKRAEKVGDNGEDRKTYVMDQAALMAAAQGVTLTEEDIILIADSVDKQVALSKEINIQSDSKVTTIMNNTTIKRP